MRKKYENREQILAQVLDDYAETGRNASRQNGSCARRGPACLAFLHMIS